MPLFPDLSKGPVGITHIGSSSSLNYQYWSSPPNITAGQFGFDGTSIFFSDLDSNGNKMTNFFENLPLNTQVIVSDGTNKAAFKIDTINAELGDVFSFNTTTLVSATFSGNQALTISFNIGGKLGITGASGPPGFWYYKKGDYNVPDGGCIGFSGTLFQIYNVDQFGNDHEPLMTELVSHGEFIVQIFKLSNPAIQVFSFTNAVTINGDYWQFQMSGTNNLDGNVVNGDDLAVFVMPVGNPATTGSVGATGAAGPSALMLNYTVNNTNAPPDAAGEMFFEGDITSLHFHYTDGNSTNVEDLLLGLPLGTLISLHISETLRYYCKLDSITDNSTYVTFGVTEISQNGDWSSVNSSPIRVTFTIGGATGNVGSTGPTGTDSYTAANSGHWATSPPTTFTSAIDRLANVVSASGGTPIP